MKPMKLEDKKKRIAALKAVYEKSDIPPVVEARIWRNLHGESAPSKEPSGRLFPAWGVGLVVVVAMITTGYGIITFDTPAAGPPVHTVVVAEAAGATHLSAGSPSESIEKSTVIKNGDVVATQKESRLVLELGPHQAIIGNNARIAFVSLDKQHLSLRLDKGSVEMSVAPLSSFQELTVETAQVTVWVKGTVFRVEEHDKCTEVTVKEGRVQVVSGDKSVDIRQGEHGRYCEGEKERTALSDSRDQRTVVEEEPKAAQEIETPQREQGISLHLDTEQSMGVTDIPTRGKERELVEKPTVSLLNSNEKGLEYKTVGTQEEQLYETAHGALVAGDTTTADRLLKQYLTRFPNGDLAEDALFRRVRIAYREHRFIAVCEYGDMFLARHSKNFGRAAEVRILCAETLMSKGDKTDKIDRLLAPLVNRLEELSNRYRQRVLYLLFRTACDEGQVMACQKWTSQYLEYFPKGRFASEAEKRRNETVP